MPAVLTLGLIFLAGCSGDSGGGSDDTHVDIHDFKFDPASITIQRGDSITFNNHDSAAHTATGDGFTTGTLASGASKTVTFDTAGTFAYRCSFHASMTGTVIVQ